MNTTATISSSTAMSNRIAAGVTAEYVRDLTRRPASAATATTAAGGAPAA